MVSIDSDAPGGEHPDQAGAMVLHGALTPAEADALMKADRRVSKRAALQAVGTPAPGSRKGAAQSWQEGGPSRGADGQPVRKRPAAARGPPADDDAEVLSSGPKRASKRPAAATRGGPEANSSVVLWSSGPAGALKRPAAKKKGRDQCMSTSQLPSSGPSSAEADRPQE
jgi:hypothetical protein